MPICAISIVYHLQSFNKQVRDARLKFTMSNVFLQFMTKKPTPFGPGLAAILARRLEPERIQKIGTPKESEPRVPRLTHPLFTEARTATIEAGTKRTETQPTNGDLKLCVVGTKATQNNNPHQDKKGF